jgi:hypothetical protein
VAVAIRSYDEHRLKDMPFEILVARQRLWLSALRAAPEGRAELGEKLLQLPHSRHRVVLLEIAQDFPRAVEEP